MVGFVGLLSCRSSREDFSLPFGLRYPTIASEQISIQTDSCYNGVGIIEILVKEVAHRVDIGAGQKEIRARFAPMDSLQRRQLQAKLSLQCTHVKMVHSRLSQ